jgi:hypothetical protein
MKLIRLSDTPYSKQRRSYVRLNRPAYRHSLRPQQQEPLADSFADEPINDWTKHRSGKHERHFILRRTSGKEQLSAEAVIFQPKRLMCFSAWGV